MSRQTRQIGGRSPGQQFEVTPTAGRWSRGRAGGETGDGDEIVCLSRAADGALAPWALALPPLTLPARPPLARASAATRRVVRERKGAFPHRPASGYPPPLGE